MHKHTQPLIALTLAATLLAFTAAAQAPKQITVRNMPPSVVKTVPPARCYPCVGLRALKELSFTFSKDMTDHSWSASQVSDDTIPSPAKARCIICRINAPVSCRSSLEPGKTVP